MTVSGPACQVCGGSLATGDHKDCAVKNDEVVCPRCGKIYVTSYSIHIARCPRCKHEIVKAPN